MSALNFDPSIIPGAWPMHEDFTLPNWDAIGEWVASQFQEDEWHEAYTILCHHWFTQLRRQLGGDYYLMESKNWLLLTSQDARAATTSINALEETTAQILREWNGVASDDGYGLNAAIIFEEGDDYYDYIGQYFPDIDAEFAASAGVMLDQGYPHIAIGNADLSLSAPTLFHELTHMLVAHLPLPLWLNEGLATSSERVLSGDKSPLLDERLAHEHKWFWNGQNIQEFWNGDSFHKPGRSQRLSYNLAEILANQLRNMPGYKDFILNAHWEDAGEKAARDHLGAGVGDVAAIFLGDGPWGINWVEEDDGLFK